MYIFTILIFICLIEIAPMDGYDNQGEDNNVLTDGLDDF